MELKNGSHPQPRDTGAGDGGEEEEFRDDHNLRRNQELGKLQRKVITAIRALAKAEKYDLVISDGVLFAGSKVDITDKVLAKLKQEAKK